MKKSSLHPERTTRAAVAPARGTSRSSTIVVAAAATLFLVVLFRTAWICDDAYITFRTVDNFLHGFGLTWNTIERVQAYTHPLWLFLLVLPCAADIDPYYASLGVSILCTVVALGLLVLRIASVRWVAAIALVVLVCSRAFVDYSTAGLENSLSHLLLGLLVVSVPQSNSPRDVGRLWILASLAMMTRMDLSLFFLPVLIAVLRPLSRAKLWAAALGLLPFLAWEVFSITYYGFPFPNPAYAKLGTGIETAALMQQGLHYLWHSIRTDPITPAAITCGLIVSWWRGAQHQRLLALGCILYLVYVIWIGGDFMAGRFLSAPLYVAVCLFARTSRLDARRAVPVLVAMALLGALWPLSPVRSGPGYGSSDESKRFYHGIADERACYFERTGLLNEYAVRDMGSSVHPWVRAVRKLGEGAYEGFVPAHGRFAGHLSTGTKGYLAGPFVYVVDADGLADALLARLPIADRDTWRIGHFHRECPPGYEETLRTGLNQIVDPDLAKLYDSVSLVTRGPIWNRRRFREIVRLNLGW